MPDSKITALTSISTSTDPANDPLVIVDLSDTSMAATGTTKKVTLNQLLGASGTATLASATITGDLTVDTNTLYVSSSADKVAIGTTSLSNEKLTVAGNISANAWLGRSNISAPAGDCSIFRSADNTLGFGIASTTAMTLNATGLGVGVVPSAGKGALQLSSGINFPSTQVASSDANTLDDYEESTWVPVITAGSGTPTTVTVNSAVYTKIGRVVVCTFDFSVVNKGTASSSLQFGLPFNSITSTAFCGSFREDGSTGNMGMVFYSTGTTAACLLYNNATPWVDGYRLKGTYTYFAA